MRAARLHAWGGVPVVEEVADPKVPPGWVLVRVLAAGVGHLDLSVAGGDFGVRPPLPYTPGVEAVGLVVAGDGFRPGARVLLRGGGPGVTGDGTWAELVAAPCRSLTPAPAGLDDPLAAVFASPATTAHVALFDVGGALRDDTVAVTGAAGAVGSIVVQLAVAAGISSVVAVVGRERHRERVPGGVEVVVGRGAGAADALGAARPTLLVDTVGGDGLAALLGTLQPGGRAALVGYTAGVELRLDLRSLLLGDVALLPVNMMRRGEQARALVPSLAERLADGRLTLAVESVPLDDADRAVQRLRRGEVVGRLALRISE